MKLTEEEQKKINEIVQYFIEELTVEQLAELHQQLEAFLGVLKK